MSLKLNKTLLENPIEERLTRAYEFRIRFKRKTVLTKGILFRIFEHIINFKKLFASTFFGILLVSNLNTNSCPIFLK